jgi:NAD(P)H-binding
MAGATEQAGVRRFVQISSTGAGASPRAGSDETFAAYRRAQTKAEEDLRRRDLDQTVLPPAGSPTRLGRAGYRWRPRCPGPISAEATWPP